MTLVVKNPDKNDLPEILSSHQAAMARKEMHWPISANDLEKIDKKNSFLIKQREGILGYLLTFEIFTETDNKRDFLAEAGEIFRTNLDRHELLAAIGLINILPEAQKKGYGKTLYEKLVQTNEKYDLRFMSPSHTESVIFHNKILDLITVKGLEKSAGGPVRCLVLKNQEQCHKCIAAIESDILLQGLK